MLQGGYFSSFLIILYVEQKYVYCIKFQNIYQLPLCMCMYDREIFFSCLDFPAPSVLLILVNRKASTFHDYCEESSIDLAVGCT
jgi:hypothetical protein